MMSCHGEARCPTDERYAGAILLGGWTKLAGNGAIMDITAAPPLKGYSVISSSTVNAVGLTALSSYDTAHVCCGLAMIGASPIGASPPSPGSGKRGRSWMANRLGHRKGLSWRGRSGHGAAILLYLGFAGLASPLAAGFR